MITRAITTMTEYLPLFAFKPLRPTIDHAPAQMLNLPEGEDMILAESPVWFNMGDMLIHDMDLPLL